MNNFSLKAVPFDSEIVKNPKTGQEEYDRVAHSKDLADLIRAYFSNGILVRGSDLLTNELQVLHLSAMSCVVKSGGIIINGRTGFLENERTLEFDVGTQNPRIDRVVAELNIAERNIFIKVLKGIAEADPKPVGIMQTEDIYQIPLAQVRVNANQSLIASVTDERGGYISNVLLNQAPSKEIMANTVGISEALRTQYGLSADNANVEKALQKIWNVTKIYKLITVTSSQNITIPNGVTEVDILAVGGGGGGASGLYHDNYNHAIGTFGGYSGSMVLAKLKVFEPNRTISIVIGSEGLGGAGSTVVSPTSRYYAPGSNGGDTTVNYMDARLIAQGGTGGTEHSTSVAKGSTTNNIDTILIDGAANGDSTQFLWINKIQVQVGSGGNGARGTFDANANPQPNVYPASNRGAGAGAGGANVVYEGYLKSVSSDSGCNATGYGCGGGSGASMAVFNYAYPAYVGKGGNGKQGIVYIGYFAE